MRGYCERMIHYESRICEEIVRGGHERRLCEEYIRRGKLFWEFLRNCCVFLRCRPSLQCAPQIAAAQKIRNSKRQVYHKFPRGNFLQEDINIPVTTSGFVEVELVKIKIVILSLFSSVMNDLNFSIRFLFSYLYCIWFLMSIHFFHQMIEL